MIHIIMSHKIKRGEKYLGLHADIHTCLQCINTYIIQIFSIHIETFIYIHSNTHTCTYFRKLSLLMLFIAI